MEENNLKKSIIVDPRKYVLWWMNITGGTVDGRGDLIHTSRRHRTKLLDSLILDYYEQIAEYNMKADKKLHATPETNLKKAFNEYIDLKKIEIRLETVEQLCFSGTENLIPLEQFILAMTGKIERKVVLVMAHFLWQVKRKMVFKKIKHHMMPVILGAQDAGKSWALVALFKPISSMVLEYTLSQATDARGYEGLHNNFVSIFNEMSGAKRTDIEDLKRQITGEYNDARILGTHDIVRYQQNCSFIGTSNKPVNEIIIDSTGARRFYQIRTLDIMNWDLLNSIDYVELYKGINEERESGYILEVREEIKEDQKELIVLDETDSFIESYNIKPGEKAVPASIIYEWYKAWAETNGVKNIRNSMFLGRRLTTRGLISKTAKVRGKSVRVYLIKDDPDTHKRTFDPLGAGVMDA